MKMFAMNRVMACVVVSLCVAFALPSVAQTTITIHTAQDLADFAARVNSGDSDAKNAEVNLMASIDLSVAGYWTPIGQYESNAFCGTFHGNKHAIYGLTCESASSNAGLFGYVGEGGVVSDLLLGGNVRLGCASGYVGGIAACNYGTISGCGSVADVTVVGSGVTMGGIVGSNGSQTSTVNAVITNCYNRGTISYSSTPSRGLGGLVGVIEAYGEVANSYSTIALSGASNVGAFYGVRNCDKDKVRNCFYDNRGDQYDEGGEIVEARSSAEMQGHGIEAIQSDAKWLFEDGYYPELFYVAYTPKATATWSEDGSLGVGTFSASDNIELPSGIVAAYTIGENNGNVLTLNQVLEGGSYLPANMPVLLAGHKGSTYNLRIVAKNVDEIAVVNLLSPHVEAGNIPTDGTKRYYGLYANGQFRQLSATGTFPAHSAYLNLESTASSPSFFTLAEDDVTGIESIPAAQPVAGSGVWYTIDGRRLPQGSQPKAGIYINNNRKVIIR